MTFAAQLRAASGTMTAAQIAAATGYSKRTVEGWRNSRRSNAPRLQNQADVLRKVAEANTEARERGQPVPPA